MFDINSLGRSLVIFGIVLIALGVLFMLGGKLPWFGRLPGDIYVQKKSFTFFFPITTSILVSIILTIIMLLLLKNYKTNLFKSSP